MDVIEKAGSRVTLRFHENELSGLSDPFIKNAESFGSAALNMAYLLKEQAYRMKNDFAQPPHAFGD